MSMIFFVIGATSWYDTPDDFEVHPALCPANLFLQVFYAEDPCFPRHPFPSQYPSS